MRISSVQFRSFFYHLRSRIDVIWRNATALKAILLLTILGTGLSSCTTTPPEPPPEPEIVQPPPDPIPRAELLSLLDAADAAIERDHLTYPREGSAFEIYHQILDRDPVQEDARRGLERIVEEYVALSMNALERRQFATARSMLARARLINPFHPSIEPSEEQIRLIQEAERTTLRLDPAEVAAETDQVRHSLERLSRDANGKSCRFVIAASSDGQGRWIYQQLAKGGDGARLRAQIRIRRPLSVERLCFET